MPYSVLIVDDSSFFQSRLKDIVNENPELRVVGVAANGQEGIDMAEKLKPDVISMDYEMPMLDGLSAVKVIMAENPRPIVMFSSMTYEGAKITLDALDAGAVDFMNKNFAEVSANSVKFKKKFHEKLITFARSKGRKTGAASSTIAGGKGIAKAPPRTSTTDSGLDDTKKKVASSHRKLKGKIKLVAIGASTGGPVAVAEIISALPENFPVPMVIIQHMPENFTKAFAERLDRQSSLTVKQAESGDRLVTGQVLVAPGGKQMMIEKRDHTIKIIDGDDRVNYRPCVDITFASAAATFNDGVLAIVLTGMGSDGCDGARLLKSKGSTIWSQDKESCVVYGMPAAVEKQDLSSSVVPLKEIANRMSLEV